MLNYEARMERIHEVFDQLFALRGKEQTIEALLGRCADEWHPLAEIDPSFSEPHLQLFVRWLELPGVDANAWRLFLLYEHTTGHLLTCTSSLSALRGEESGERRPPGALSRG